MIKIDSSEYVTQFLLRLDLFQMKKMTSERKKKHLMWKIANIEAFSSTKPYATKYSPFKNCILYITFHVFIQRCVYWLLGTCFVKVKINPDIILSEITFDYSVVKRWVAYFFNSLLTNSIIITVSNEFIKHLLVSSISIMNKNSTISMCI